MVEHQRPDLISVVSDVPMNRAYMKNGTVFQMPEPPDENHVFNIETEHWEVNSKIAEERLRSEIKSLLSETDWTQLPDTEVDKEAWASYRKELRHLLKNTSDPVNVVLPAKPKD